MAQKHISTISPAGVFLVAIMVIMALSRVANAGVDLTPAREIKLAVQPLDVATSPDGKLVFVLAPGRLLVYSLPGYRLTNRISLSGDFNRLTYSPVNRQLILTSTSSRALKIIRVESVYAIDISGCPFKGPANAPVTITVFDDYQ